MNAPMSDFGQMIFEQATAINRAVAAGIAAGTRTPEPIAQQLAHMLEEALEFLADQEDVIDGDYGVPEPNRAMQLAQEIRIALARYELSKQ